MGVLAIPIGSIISVDGSFSLMADMLEEDFMSSAVPDFVSKHKAVFTLDTLELHTLELTIAGNFDLDTGLGTISHMTLRDAGSTVARASFSTEVSVDLFGDGTGQDLSQLLNLDLTGTTGNDTMLGWGLDDLMRGRAGNDLMAGDDGNDTILGGSGDDTVLGGQGSDTLVGAKGNDTALGGPGHDVIAGGRDDDVLAGGAGDDTVLGGKGADILIADGGSDLLRGGANADVFVFAFDGGKGSIADFQAGDLVLIATATPDATQEAVDELVFNTSTLDQFFGDVPLSELTGQQVDYLSAHGVTLSQNGGNAVIAFGTGSVEFLGLGLGDVHTSWIECSEFGLV